MDDILIEAAGVLREEIDIPSRASRKIAGSTLFVSVFVYVVLLPLAFIGQMFTLLGRLLKYPLRKLGMWMVPAAVRLWYIHRVGRVHPWQCAKSRIKKQLNAHSRSIRVDVRGNQGVVLHIHTVSQLHDNYAYLVVNPKAVNQVYHAFVIDCGDATSLLKEIEGIRMIHYRDGVIQIEAILTTHHHWDHMGGNEDLKVLHPGINCVVGGRHDRVSGVTRTVAEGDVLELLNNESNEPTCQIYCHEMPGHTLGSICYRLRSEDHETDCLFLGDTFFIGGSGANFEGDSDMMVRNFTRLYITCHPNTLLFPGHEYSERILSTLFPERGVELAKVDSLRYLKLAQQLNKIVHLRSQSYPSPTIPVTLDTEVSYNPNFADVIAACRTLMAAIYSYQGRLSTTAITECVTEKWQRMSPKIALNEGKCMLVEPPWIRASNADTFQAPSCSVERGFELFFHPKRFPHSVSSLNESLSSLYLPLEGNSYVVHLALLEKCAKYPMGTGFPGLDDSQLNEFRQIMIELVDKDHMVTVDAHPSGGVYIRSECLLAFVLTALRPSLTQICKIYGKSFRDLKCVKTDSPQIPTLRLHTLLEGGSLMSMPRSLKFPFHDFTECKMCNARPVYVRGQPLVHQRDDVDAAVENLLKRLPTTLSVLDCMVESSAETNS